MSDKRTSKFQYPDVFVTEFGDELALPRPTAKVERQVYENVGAILQDFPAIRSLVSKFLGSKSKEASNPLEGDWSGDIIDVLQQILVRVPEPLSKIAQAILGIGSVDEVEEKLTYADMIRLIVLFFRLQTSRFSNASVNLIEDFGLSKEDMPQLAAQAVEDEATV